MAQDFDERWWEAHWQQAGGGHGPGQEIDPNPWLVRETAALVPGSALDAGCGEGAEAVFLATAGWQVTAVDVSATVLARAAELAASSGAAPERLRFVEADLATWEPDQPFDLVTTHYAHPALPQLAFYDRLAGWVAPGGTLLIVGHQHVPGEAGHGHGPPDEATVTAASTVARLDPARWDVATAEERTRTLVARGGRAVELHDVIVRATRHP